MARSTKVIIPERIYRLGRHVVHDPRSRNFAYEPTRKTLVSATHKRMIPVLDQGNLGSCTGNAAVGALGTAPLFATKPAAVTLNETYAVKVYSKGTTVDGVPGQYPPTDTGCTGLGVAKACKAFGLISGYQHCFDLNTALAALMRTPIIIGINWYSSFDHPDISGKIYVKTGAYVRGGHEVVLDALNVSQHLVWGTNSWSPLWGYHGRFWMSWATLGRLLSEQGDATVLLPRVA